MKEVPKFHEGDHVRVMHTDWAATRGIENETGVIHQVNDDGYNCLVLLDREHLFRFNDIPASQLMRIS